jgi:hypothetical protein
MTNTPIAGNRAARHSRRLGTSGFSPCAVSDCDRESAVRVDGDWFCTEHSHPSMRP